MYRAFVATMMGSVMLCAASADAGEAVLSLESRIGGDSNIFRQPQGKVDDGFFELVPRLRVREQREELNYNFEYVPVYETYFETSGIDGWDQGANGRVEWRATPRDTLGVVGRFSNARRVRQDFIRADITADPVVDESDRERIRRGSTSVFYSHAFTPRLSGRVSLDFEDIDFNAPNNVDTRAYGGTLSGSYALTDRTSVGLSGSGRYRENLGVGVQTSSTSRVGSIAASLSHELLTGLSFSVQIGPSFIRTEEDDRTGLALNRYEALAISGTQGVGRAIELNAPRTICMNNGQDRFFGCPFLVFDGQPPPTTSDVIFLAPPADGRGRSESSTSFFAEIEVRKEWQWATAILGYTRAESANSGDASSSIVDTAIARVILKLGQEWHASLRGEWSRRDVVSDVRQTVVLAAPDPAAPLTPSAPVPPGGPFTFATPTALTTVVAQEAGNSDVTQWRLHFVAERDLTKQIRLIGQVSYSQTDNNIGRVATDVDSVLGYVAIRYTFEPLLF